jgi:hypothetical protein
VARTDLPPPPARKSHRIEEKRTKTLTMTSVVAPEIEKPKALAKTKTTGRGRDHDNNDLIRGQRSLTMAPPPPRRAESLVEDNMSSKRTLTLTSIGAPEIKKLELPKVELVETKTTSSDHDDNKEVEMSRFKRVSALRTNTPGTALIKRRVQTKPKTPKEKATPSERSHTMTMRTRKPFVRPDY